jgi:hypothetical protein
VSCTAAAAWPYDEAASVLSEPFAEALVLDQRVRAPKAEALGWKPAGPSAVADLREGSYAGGAA